MTKEEGDRASTSGRDGLNSPCARFFVFRSVPKAAKSLLFWGAGEKGYRLEGSGNQSTCEGADRVG